MLKPYDVVVINSDYEDAEVAGKRGTIIGLVESDQIGVFVYDENRVWCLHPRDVAVTGERDTHTEPSLGTAIRVNSKGEVLG
jgi:hypothetical protein